jgi:hypothetical protein
LVVRRLSNAETVAAVPSRKDVTFIVLSESSPHAKGAFCSTTAVGG